MRNLIILVATLVSFTTFGQDTANKFRIGLAGTAYLNFDKANKSNSQYVEINFDYAFHERVRVGLGLDYNITNKSQKNISLTDLTYMNSNISRSGLGAQGYIDYLFMKKTNFDMYARIGIGSNFPMAQVTEQDHYDKATDTKIKENDFNTSKSALPIQIRYTIGVGGEYKIKDFMSVGLELNYRYAGLAADQTYGLGLKLGVNYRF